MTFKKWLELVNACEDAREWVGDKTAQEAWDTCPRGDWLMWWITKYEDRYSKRDLRLLACAFASRVLHIFEKACPDDFRPRMSIDVAMQYAEGVVDGQARDAAWDAARDAAWDAAGDAAWDAARDAAGDAAGDAERKAQADIIRDFLDIPTLTQWSK